jgi:hypothetical protein
MGPALGSAEAPRPSPLSLTGMGTSVSGCRLGPKTGQNLALDNDNNIDNGMTFLHDRASQPDNP